MSTNSSIGSVNIDEFCADLMLNCINSNGLKTENLSELIIIAVEDPDIIQKAYLIKNLN